MSRLPLVCCGAVVRFSNHCRGRGFPYGTVGDVPHFFLDPLVSTFLLGVGRVVFEFNTPIQVSAFSRRAEGTFVQIDVDILLGGWPT